MSTCKTCRHFHPDPVESDPGQGQCRRFPPTLVAVVTTQIHDVTNKPVQQIVPISRFPITSEELACGEHVPAIALMS